MTQMQFIIFFYILPILVGFIFGMIFWKFKKSYFLIGVMIAICVIWWTILSNINLHGSEGPGLVFCMYSNLISGFSVVEIVKFLVRKIKSRGCHR